MRLKLKLLNVLCVLVLATPVVLAKEYHVSVNGCDHNNGSTSKPFKTISAAATAAQPGDVITVHAGTYRERINPPRGGTSEKKRITYRAAKGEKVVIKGSEVVKGWEKVQDDPFWSCVYFSREPTRETFSGDW